MRYFIGLFVAIGLIILIIVLILTGGSKPKVPATAKTLDSYYNTDAVVRLTIDGPINAPQNHQTVQITVGRDSTDFVMEQGYDGDVTSSQDFPNSQNSYSVFLHSLSVAGYTKGDTDSSRTDERGYCADGERYIFQVIQDGKDIERFWGTSCGNPKTYGGNINLTLDLFEAQVPNYADLTQNFVL